MNAKGRRYLLLLLISIAIRTFFYFFRFEGTFFEGIANAHILYDVIFYSVMISLLETLKERKWLVGLAWGTLTAMIAFNLIEWARPRYLTLTQSLARFMIVISLVFLIFNVSLFFIRKSPARIFFRLLSVVMSLDYIYGAYVGLFYPVNPDNWLMSRAGYYVIAILDNLLLLLAVLRTPELRKPPYADFLE
ncbi:MAG TPA: hypothetical protein VGS79_22395 [Puia sp.]|nr:hypothetical protein [Puia sp.]